MKQTVFSIFWGVFAVLLHHVSLNVLLCPLVYTLTCAIRLVTRAGLPHVAPAFISTLLALPPSLPPSSLPIRDKKKRKIITTQPSYDIFVVLPTRATPASTLGRRGTREKNPCKPSLHSFHTCLAASQGYCNTRLLLSWVTDYLTSIYRNWGKSGATYN